jgi:ribosomal protein S18 acetylase RimI-like enzyme
LAKYGVFILAISNCRNVGFLFFQILCYNDFMDREKLSENQGEQNVSEIEILQGFDQKNLKDILMLEKECFPVEWQYPDAEEYYRKVLENKENISIFLKDKEKTVGYILAVPLNGVVGELKEWDPGIKKDEKKFYIETIQILPEFQGKSGAKKLLIATCEEVLKRGFNEFAIHARTINGFNAKIKKMFGDGVMLARKIEKWKPANNEPYEYIEWVYKKPPEK